MMNENVLRSVWRGNWVDVLLRAAVAVIFGLLLIFQPRLTIAVFVLVFGAFALVDGLLLVLYAITAPKQGNWWISLVQGLFSIGAGIAVFLWPGLSILILALFLAAYFLVTGALQMIAAIDLRKLIKGELLLLISGFLGLVIGLLLLVRPFSSLVALAQTIGIFAIAYGILLGFLAFKLRSAVGKAAAAT